MIICRLERFLLENIEKLSADLCSAVRGQAFVRMPAPYDSKHFETYWNALFQFVTRLFTFRVPMPVAKSHPCFEL